MTRHIALLCNPTSAKALQVGNAIAVLLRGKKISFSLFTAYWPTVWDGFSEAWLAGGDGTAHFFINQNPFFQLPIALFAGGTGNDLHALLYGKIKLAQQVALVLAATARPVDAGLCNGVLFLNGIGIGFDGAVAEATWRAKKGGRKTAYIAAILKNLAGYRERPYTITTAGTNLTQACFMISIANGRSFGGGFRVAPHASVTDGVLDVLRIGPVNLLQRLRYLPVIQKGRHLHLPFITYQQTTAVTITCATAVAAHRDGEYFTADRFEIAVLKNRFSLLW